MACGLDWAGKRVVTVVVFFTASSSVNGGESLYLQDACCCCAGCETWLLIVYALKLGLKDSDIGSSFVKVQ